MTKFGHAVFVLLGSGLMVTGFFHTGLIPLALVCLLICLLWFVAAWLRWTWLVNISFLGVFSIAGAGILLGLSPILGIGSVIAGMLAWDSYHFLIRFPCAAPEDNSIRLERYHFIRLFIIGILSFGLGLLVVNIHYTFSFEWTLVFLVMAIGGIVWLTRLLRKMI